MVLNGPQIQRVEDETGAMAIPQDNPSLAELKSAFGAHTFFIDDDGLHVWERLTDGETESAKLVGIRLASWSDRTRATLIPHEPAPTQVLEEIN